MKSQTVDSVLVSRLFVSPVLILQILTYVRRTENGTVPFPHLEIIAVLGCQLTSDTTRDVQRDRNCSFHLRVLSLLCRVPPAGGMSVGLWTWRVRVEVKAVGDHTRYGRKRCDKEGKRQLDLYRPRRPAYGRLTEDIKLTFSHCELINVLCLVRCCSSLQVRARTHGIRFRLAASPSLCQAGLCMVTTMREVRDGQHTALP